MLIFKEVEWHCLRIEANSTSIMNLSPLKLLTESASCRIVIKKRISGNFLSFTFLKIISLSLLFRGIETFQNFFVREIVSQLIRLG